jgi:hypothetical protein
MFRRPPCRASGHIQAIHVKWADVHVDNTRAQLPCQLVRTYPAHRFAYHPDVGVIAELHSHPNLRSARVQGRQRSGREGGGAAHLKTDGTPASSGRKNTKETFLFTYTSAEISRVANFLRGRWPPPLGGSTQLCGVSEWGIASFGIFDPVIPWYDTFSHLDIS